MKLPTLNDVMSMSSKFIKDVSRSVCEIVAEYKQKQKTAEPKDKNKKEKDEKK